MPKRYNPNGSEDLPVITRRGLFMGVAATLIWAPSIVQAPNLMAVQTIILPAQRGSYGFNDRLRIDWLYRSGQLRGNALNRAMEQGLLNHI